MLYKNLAACSGGRIVSWIIYCWLIWCERKTLFPAGNLRSFTSKRTGCIVAALLDFFYKHICWNIEFELARMCSSKYYYDFPSKKKYYYDLLIFLVI